MASARQQSFPVAVTMGVYRLALGVALSFFFRPWQVKIGVGWLFGMAAFFCLFALLIVAFLVWQGARLMHFVFFAGTLLKTEEGLHPIERHP